MLRRHTLHRLVFVYTLFHLFSSARGGDSGADGLTLSGDSGRNSSFHLAPIDAAHFAFCVIFAVLTALQTLQAVGNIRKRIIGLPPSISLPDFSVGNIFPISLLISTVCRTISYTLHAVYWARITNFHITNLVDFTPAYLGAWNATGFLADIFLLSAIFALLSHREKILLDTSRSTRQAKKIMDAILVLTLIGLSMGNIGLGVTGGDKAVGHKLYLAYLIFFLFGVLNIAVYSTTLFVYSRDSLVDDHSITLYTSFIISPLFFVYSVFPLLLECLFKPDTVPSADKDEEQWALASLIVGCITEVVITQACLIFGMPPLFDNDEVEVENPPSGKA